MQSDSRSGSAPDQTAYRRREKDRRNIAGKAYFSLLLRISDARNRGAASVSP